MATTELPPVPKPPETELTSVGNATMEADGTLRLMLRSVDDDDGILEALAIYRPDDANYAAILKRLGNIKPGESCLISPA